MAYDEKFSNFILKLTKNVVDIFDDISMVWQVQRMLHNVYMYLSTQFPRERNQKVIGNPQSSKGDKLTSNTFS